jgi:tetratricopeptide (TPR) repeat protein
MTASLALAWHGRARRIAIVAVTFSIAAVAFSGTRGAWLGLLAGAATIVLLELRALRGKDAIKNMRMVIRVAFACAGVLILVLVIVSSPASRDVALRARSFAEDRFTGSGRILLWRDALKMVPRFALIGAGPEAFSREFLAFKSPDLARSAPQINNENPHNSFMDAAISVGLPGAILYAAFICSAFSLVLRARRSANRRIALISSGLLASLVAVTVHNLFIYDQIPTGLYFFTFNALALIAWNLTKAHQQSAGEGLPSEQPGGGLRWTALAITSSGAVLLVAATWFSASIISGDVELKRAMLFARAGDYEGLVAHGGAASRNPDPTGAYNFQFARALAIYADSIPGNAELASPQNNRSEKADTTRSQALEAAVEQAQRSLPHSLTPDGGYVLLAYLALAQGDNSKLHDYAGKAIDWDPNYFNARWLMAEALLAEGDREGAAAQAQVALRLRPASSEARSVLARARGESPLISPRIQGLVERARSLMERRNFDKAEDLLQRAIRDAHGPCVDCHRQLALNYQETGRYKDAIAEWEMVVLGSPNQEEVRRAHARIDALKNK